MRWEAWVLVIAFVFGLLMGLVDEDRAGMAMLQVLASGGLIWLVLRLAGAA